MTERYTMQHSDGGYLRMTVARMPMTDGSRLTEIDRWDEYGNRFEISSTRAAEILRFWRALERIAPNDYTLTRERF